MKTYKAWILVDKETGEAVPMGSRCGWFIRSSRKPARRIKGEDEVVKRCTITIEDTK